MCGIVGTSLIYPIRRVGLKKWEPIRCDRLAATLHTGDVNRGLNGIQPRNLAKSVTVE